MPQSRQRNKKSAEDYKSRFGKYPSWYKPEKSAREKVIDYRAGAELKYLEGTHSPEDIEILKKTGDIKEKKEPNKLSDYKQALIRIEEQKFKNFPVSGEYPGTATAKADSIKVGLKEKVKDVPKPEKYKNVSKMTDKELDTELNKISKDIESYLKKDSDDKYKFTNVGRKATGQLEVRQNEIIKELDKRRGKYLDF